MALDLGERAVGLVLEAPERVEEAEQPSDRVLLELQPERAYCQPNILEVDERVPATVVRHRELDAYLRLPLCRSPTGVRQRREHHRELGGRDRRVDLQPSEAQLERLLALRARRAQTKLMEGDVHELARLTIDE